MNKKITMLLIIILVIASSVACGGKNTKTTESKDEETEITYTEDKKDSVNIAEEYPEDHESNINIDVMPEIDTEGETEEESADERGTDMDLVKILNGGFFYTSNENDDFREMRQDAMVLFENLIGNVAVESFGVTDHLEMYEEMLLTSSEEIEEVVLNDLIVKMYSYKTALAVYEEAIKTYNNLESKNPAIAAVFERYKFEAVYNLVDLQETYLSWLMGTTEVIAVLIEDIDTEASDGFIDLAINTFTLEVKEPFEKMLLTYCQASEVYSYIYSADYYMSEYILAEINKQLDTFPVEYEDELKSIVDHMNGSNRKPSFLIELDDETISNLNAKSSILPFVVLAYADDDFNKELNKRIAINILEKVAVASWNSRVAEAWAYEPGMYDKAIEIMMTDIFLNIDINEIRKEYDAKINQSNTKYFRNRIYRTNDSMKSNSEISKKYSSMKQMGLINLNRTDIVNKISQGQLLAGFMVFSDADEKYTTMINALQSFLDKTDKLDIKQIEEMNQLLNKDLDEILGDKKNVFIEKLLSTKAEELADLFITWKDSRENFNNLNFNKNDLIDLVKLLGIGMEKYTIAENEKNKVAGNYSCEFYISSYKASVFGEFKDSLYGSAEYLETEAYNAANFWNEEYQDLIGKVTVDHNNFNLTINEDETCSVFLSDFLGFQLALHTVSDVPFSGGSITVNTTVGGRKYQGYIDFYLSNEKATMEGEITEHTIVSDNVEDYKTISFKGEKLISR